MRCEKESSLEVLAEQSAKTHTSSTNFLADTLMRPLLLLLTSHLEFHRFQFASVHCQRTLTTAPRQGTHPKLPPLTISIHISPFSIGHHQRRVRHSIAIRSSGIDKLSAESSQPPPFPVIPRSCPLSDQSQLSAIANRHSSNDNKVRSRTLWILH